MSGSLTAAPHSHIHAHAVTMMLIIMLTVQRSIQACVPILRLLTLPQNHTPAPPLPLMLPPPRCPPHAAPTGLTATTCTPMLPPASAE